MTNTKIRSEQDLFERLDEDLIWRKKELTQFKFLLETCKTKKDPLLVILRAAVTLLYAHWEGFIKAASQAYFEFVSQQQLNYEELDAPFLALAIRGRLNSAAGAKRIAAHLDLVRFFRQNLTDRSRLPRDVPVVRTANLSSDILEEILGALGLEFAPFATKRKLIDESLLKRRNTVAHGEYLTLTLDNYLTLASEVLGMMENFRTQVENAVLERRYRLS